MSVMRVHKNKNYTVMSNFHFRERAMSLKAKGLLSLMLSLPDDWDYSVSGLVTLSKDGKDSVMAALSELEKFGYLKRTRLTNLKGQFQGVEYNIYELPQQAIPNADKQHEDLQNSENSNADKPQQLKNTKLTNELIKQSIDEVNTKVLDEMVESSMIKELYQDYIEVREEIKHPMSKYALKALIRRVNKLSNGDIELQRELLEAAIINGWKNVYSPAADDAPAEIRDNRLYKRLAEFYS